MFLVDHGPNAGEGADFQSHRLDKLWAKCVRVINYYYPNDLEKEEISVIEGVISEFTNADKDSFTYRYAYNRDGLA